MTTYIKDIAKCLAHKTFSKNFKFPIILFFLTFWLYHREILVPWPGMEPGPPAVETWNLSHWTTRDIPKFLILEWIIQVVFLEIILLIWYLQDAQERDNFNIFPALFAAHCEQYNICGKLISFSAKAWNYLYKVRKYVIFHSEQKLANKMLQIVWEVG